MFFWNSLAFSMIQQMLAIWSLVPLPSRKPAWTSGIHHSRIAEHMAYQLSSQLFPLNHCDLKKKGMTEDEMAGWLHWLDGRESEWTPGVCDGQGGLACCDSWGQKESDTTEWLNWTEQLEKLFIPRNFFRAKSRSKSNKYWIDKRILTKAHITKY